MMHVLEEVLRTMGELKYIDIYIYIYCSQIPEMLGHFGGCFDLQQP